MVHTIVETISIECNKNDLISEEMKEFLEYTSKLRYADKPDYNHCRQIFKNAMKKCGYTDDKLQLSAATSSKTHVKAAAKVFLATICPFE